MRTPPGVLFDTLHLCFMKMDDDSEVIGWEDCDEMKINNDSVGAVADYGDWLAVRYGNREVARNLHWICKETDNRLP